MDNQKHTVIYDMLFQLRNSMDKHVRQLRDVQNVLSIMENGFEYIQGDSKCESSTVRIMLRYLKELEINMVDYENQVSLIEDMVEVNPIK